MSGVEGQEVPAASSEDDGRSRRRLFVGAGVIALVLLAIAAYAWGASSKGEEVFAEPAASIGMDPFTTEGVMPVSNVTDDQTTTTSGSSTGTKPPGLFGGSSDDTVCDPARAVAFLAAHPDKAAAWVVALNSDPTLRWSKGNSLTVADIPAYVAELKPTVLRADARVTNHGFKNGKPTPRQSVLQKGTAVMVDAEGIPRARCKCFNALKPPKPVSNPEYVGEKWDDFGPPFCSGKTCVDPPPPTTSTTEIKATTTTEIKETTTTRSDVIKCPAIPPVPANATDVTTAPVDFDGNGTADLLRVYRVGSVWHVRAEIGGLGIDDEVIPGPGPSMSAVGGATINPGLTEEAWVKVGQGAATDILGIYVFRSCDLQRVLLRGAGPVGGPAEFPVGASATAADSVQCFGNNVGIEVETTTSSDGTNYSGTSQMYTLDLSGPNPVLVPQGPPSNISTPGTSVTNLSDFICDSLTTIP